MNAGFSVFNVLNSGLKILFVFRMPIDWDYLNLLGFVWPLIFYTFLSSGLGINFIANFLFFWFELSVPFAYILVLLVVADPSRVGGSVYFNNSDC